MAGRGRPDRLGRRVLRRISRGQGARARPAVGRPPGDGAGRRAADAEGVVTVAVRTLAGTFLVDLESEEVVGETEPFEPARVSVELPRVVAAAAMGATVVAVVDRRPPLAISNDAGR